MNLLSHQVTTELESLSQSFSLYAHSPKLGGVSGARNLIGGQWAPQGFPIRILRNRLDPFSGLVMVNARAFCC